MEVAQSSGSVGQEGNVVPGVAHEEDLVEYIDHGLSAAG